MDIWTTKEVREIRKSHLNYVVADTRRWEEQAAYYLDTNDKVEAFVKNQGLNFASRTFTTARPTTTSPTSSSASRPPAPTT